MDANARHFEAELEAQHEEFEDEVCEIQAEAEVVSATAL